LPHFQLSRLKYILELGEGSAGPALEKRQVLEKIDKFILILHLDLFKDSFIDILADDSEVAIAEATDCGQTGFIVD
jgi:hypothetical protein